MDPELTTVRLVTNPEKIVLKETQRAFMYFCLYKMNIDAIIMNRIWPENLKDAYFKEWIKEQKHYVEEAQEYFNPVPIFPVNLFSGEILGYDNLKSLAAQIYGEKNPVGRFFSEEPYNLVKEGENYRLRLKLPFILKKDVDLNKTYDELIIRIGGFKRHVLLPRPVASLNSVKAVLEGQYLDILFEGDDHERKRE
jgi:arsenite-transporting ATPase